MKAIESETSQDEASNPGTDPFDKIRNPFQKGPLAALLAKTDTVFSHLLQAPPAKVSLNGRGTIEIHTRISDPDTAVDYQLPNGNLGVLKPTDILVMRDATGKFLERIKVKDDRIHLKQVIYDKNLLPRDDGNG
jgi:hypothetical protein